MVDANAGSNSNSSKRRSSTFGCLLLFWELFTKANNKYNCTPHTRSSNEWKCKKQRANSWEKKFTIQQSIALNARTARWKLFPLFVEKVFFCSEWNRFRVLNSNVKERTKHLLLPIHTQNRIKSVASKCTAVTCDRVSSRLTSDPIKSTDYAIKTRVDGYA